MMGENVSLLMTILRLNEVIHDAALSRMLKC
jgi:hypothetical protein